MGLILRPGREGAQQRVRPRYRGQQVRRLLGRRRDLDEPRGGQVRDEFRQLLVRAPLHIELRRGGPHRTHVLEVTHGHVHGQVLVFDLGPHRLPDTRLVTSMVRQNNTVHGRCLQRRAVPWKGGVSCTRTCRKQLLNFRAGYA